MAESLEQPNPNEASGNIPSDNTQECLCDEYGSDLCLVHKGTVEQKYDAALTEIQRLRAQVEARKQELLFPLRAPDTGELTTLRLYLKDTSEDMECLPKCDSDGHEEFCPVTNVMAAFRLLREQLAALKKYCADIEAEREKDGIGLIQIREQLAAKEKELAACLQRRSRIERH